MHDKEIKKRQRKKPYSGKLAIRSDHPRHPIEILFGMVTGLLVVVISIKFCQHRLSGYRAFGGLKFGSSHYLGQRLIQQPYSHTAVIYGRFWYTEIGHISHCILYLFITQPPHSVTTTQCLKCIILKPEKQGKQTVPYSHKLNQTLQLSKVQLLLPRGELYCT